MGPSKLASLSRSRSNSSASATGGAMVMYLKMFVTEEEEELTTNLLQIDSGVILEASRPARNRSETSFYILSNVSGVKIIIRSDLSQSQIVLK